MSTVHEKYSLVQHTWSQEEDWWQWKVWIKADEKDLNKIEAVEYTLHSTFSNPVRVVKDKATNFAIEEEGWGGFTLYAKVILNDQTNVLLEHNLTLQDAHGEPAGHPTKGLSFHKVKTLAAPAPLKRAAVGKTVAFGAGIGVVVLAAIFFFSVSNDDYKNASIADGDTDGASYPLDTAAITGPVEDVDTGNLARTDTLVYYDSFKQRKPFKIPVSITKYRSLQGDMIKGINDTAVVRDPALWLGYFAEELNQRDQKILLLQKELDSLKSIMRLKIRGKQRVGSDLNSASQQ